MAMADLENLDDQLDVELTLQTLDGNLKLLLTNLDTVCNDDYSRLSEQIERRDSKKGSHKGAIIKGIVSRNRMRYKDKDFNLDLSYITRRIIAMGYPGSGLNSLVRNNVDDVVSYCKKYHNLKIKIYSS